MAIIQLDEIDEKIISILKENARTSYSDIGDSVGLTRVAIKNRMTALEKKGIIKGYKVDVDPMTISDASPFYAYFETKPDSYDKVANQLKEDPVVSLLFRTSGTNAMVAICIAQSKEERTQFAYRVRNVYEGITGFNARDIWEVLKGSIIQS